MSFTRWKLPQFELHRADLERRGITIKQATERGYEPLTADQTKREIGQDVGPTIAITCFHDDGSPKKHRRFRLLDAYKIAARDDQRYTQKAKTGTLIHIRHPKKPNRAFRKVRVITEGEIKADEIAEKIGVTTISVPGVNSFRKDGELHPDIACSIGVAIQPNLHMTPTKNSNRMYGARCSTPLTRWQRRASLFGSEYCLSCQTARSPGPMTSYREQGAEAYVDAPTHNLDSPACKEVARGPVKVAAPIGASQPRPGGSLLV